MRSAARKPIRSARRANSEQTAPPSLREGSPPNLAGNGAPRYSQTFTGRSWTRLIELLVAQRFNRVDTGRFYRRIGSKQNADRDGNAKRHDDGGGGHDRFPFGSLSDQPCEEK